MRVSEDILTVKPAFLISTRSNVQFGVIYRLLIPLAIALTEQSLHCEFVEINHLIVQESGVFGLWEFSLGAHVTIRPRNNVFESENLSMITCCTQCNDSESLVLWIKFERCVKVSLRIESTLLYKIVSTLVNSVGSSCLYLSAASLLLKMSPNISAEYKKSYM